VSVSAGAGIRFGGYEATDGIESSAVDNVLVASRRYGLLVLRRPQGRICGNVVRHASMSSPLRTSVRPRVVDRAAVAGRTRRRTFLASPTLRRSAVQHAALDPGGELDGAPGIRAARLVPAVRRGLPGTADG
jgi:hypothetical protein